MKALARRVLTKIGVSRSSRGDIVTDRMQGPQLWLGGLGSLKSHPLDGSKLWSSELSTCVAYNWTSFLRTPPHEKSFCLLLAIDVPAIQHLPSPPNLAMLRPTVQCRFQLSDVLRCWTIKRTLSNGHYHEYALLVQHMCFTKKELESQMYKMKPRCFKVCKPL